jgi:hypothetical protein
MKSLTLPITATATAIDAELDTDIGGYAYYSFYFVARSGITQTSGRAVINDTGNVVTMNVDAQTLPSGNSAVISLSVQYVNGRRRILYTAPAEISFHYQEDVKLN